MKKKLLYIASAIVLFTACETQVNPELNASLNILVVDAWLTDNDPIQHINITRSQPYFDTSAPAKVSGATVIVTDLTDNTVYPFIEGEQLYTWVSPDGNSLGVVGHKYELFVEVNGNTYTSVTTLNEVPPVDSVTFRLEEGNSFFDDLIFGEFFATDLQGTGDTYWIKAWKNGRFLGRPEELNFAYDAVFSEDIDNDGVQFIQPIRDLISPLEVDKDDDILSPYNLPQQFLVRDNTIYFDNGSIYGTIANDSITFVDAKVPEDFKSVSLDDDQYNINGDSLFVKGDSVYVEIHSISNEAYFFLNQVLIETSREGGFGALFATPLANVSTNIIPDDPSNLVAGFFNVASVSGDGNRLTSEEQIRVLE